MIFASSRFFLTALLTVVLSMASGPDLQAGTKYTRQSLQEFVKDPKKLISLIRGVHVMKQRNSSPKDSAQYRTSWEYWAAIHGYAGATSGSGTLKAVREFFESEFPQQAPLLAGFYNGLEDLDPPAQPAGLAADTWATCRHGSPDQYEPHFLSWHRMYLFFFERVLREASGDPDFALPYWDYTNATADPTEPANSPWRVPSIFLYSGQINIGGGPVPNPLFEGRRTPGFGEYSELDILDTNVDSLLALKDFDQFQNGLDLSIHAHIHCALGNGCMAPYMGIVPFAGNEPIFWLHHANVDRLWQCWTKRNGREANPVSNPDWMKEEFIFVDEKGERATMKVAELLDEAGRIDYTYDSIDKCFRKEPPETEEEVAFFKEDSANRTMQIRKKQTPIASAGAIRVDKAEQEFPLATTSSSEARDALFFAVRPTVIRPSRALLRFEGLRISKPTGASVRVYLADKLRNRRAFVSSINFFGWFDRGHGDHAAEPGKGRNVSFDVTSQLRELLVDNPAGENISLVLAATNGLEGVNLPLNTEAYEGAGLSIQKIVLDVEERSGNFDFR